MPSSPDNLIGQKKNKSQNMEVPDWCMASFKCDQFGEPVGSTAEGLQKGPGQGKAQLGTAPLAGGSSAGDKTGNAVLTGAGHKTGKAMSVSKTGGKKRLSNLQAFRKANTWVTEKSAPDLSDPSATEWLERATRVRKSATVAKKESEK